MNGEKYRIMGSVVQGKQLGRTIGFPTANILPDAAPDLPRGVYAAWLTVDGRRHGCMVNIGHHPTLPEGAPTIEAHVFDFSGDLYGKRVLLETAAFLRREQKFPSVEALRAQLERDRLTALALLES